MRKIMVPAVEIETTSGKKYYATLEEAVRTEKELILDFHNVRVKLTPDIPAMLKAAGENIEVVAINKEVIENAD